MKTQYAPIFSFHYPMEPAAFSFFDIGKGKSYHSNNSADKQVEIGCTVLLQKLIDKVKNDGFKCSMSLSGTYLELLETSYPEHLSDLNKLIRKGSIELIGGTYYHSMSSCISESLFEFEVAQLQNKFYDLFKIQPTVFQNTVHLYHNTVSSSINKLSFQACIVEMNKWHLNGIKEVGVMQSSMNPSLKILLNASEETTNNKFNMQVMNGYGIPYHKEVSTLFWEGLDGGSNMTINELLDTTTEPTPTYVVPLTLAMRNNEVNIDTLVHTPLQKDVIAIINRLEQEMAINSNYDFMAELSFFSSYDFLKRLNSTNQENNAYEVYLTYINMLADLELKIKG